MRTTSRIFGSLFCLALSATAPAHVIAADGAALYAEHCAVCHGVNLEGEADWRIQNEDGSIRVPDVLKPYMGGLEVIAA